MEGYKGTLFLVALFLQICFLQVFASPVCYIVRNNPMPNGDYWWLSIPSYNTPKFNSKTQIEWEIRADIDDWGEVITSYEGWKSDAVKGGNAVRVIGREEPLHANFTERLEESVFLREWNDDDQTAMLTITVSSSDAKRTGFLSVKLLLVPLDLLPTDWPRTDKEISMWTGSLKLTMLDNQYEKLTTIEAINDVSVTFSGC